MHSMRHPAQIYESVFVVLQVSEMIGRLTNSCSRIPYHTPFLVPAAYEILEQSFHDTSHVSITWLAVSGSRLSNAANPCQVCTAPDRREWMEQRPY